MSNNFNFLLIVILVLFTTTYNKTNKSNLKKSTAPFDVLKICPIPDFREEALIVDIITSANKLECNKDRSNLIIKKLKEDTLMIKNEDIVRILTKVKYCDGFREVLQTIDPYIFRLAPEQLKTIIELSDNKRQQIMILEELGDTMSDASKATKDLLISVLKCKGDADSILAGIQPRNCLIGRVSQNQMIVIDVSVSMETYFYTNQGWITRLEYVKPVMKYLVDLMDDTMKFNIIYFSDNAYGFERQFVNADKSAKSSAKLSIDNLGTIASTNINEAILLAMNYKEKDYSIFFLTDGYPTVGVTDTNQILKNVVAANKTRIKNGLLAVKVNVSLIMLGEYEDDEMRELAADFAQALAKVTGGTFKNYTI